MAVRGEKPPATRAFTAFISGFDTFQTPYFKAIHFQYNFFLNIIPKKWLKHNRRMDFCGDFRFQFGEPFQITINAVIPTKAKPHGGIFGPI
jgi:hypothetical protein